MAVKEKFHCSFQTETCQKDDGMIKFKFVIGQVVKNFRRKFVSVKSSVIMSRVRFHCRFFWLVRQILLALFTPTYSNRDPDTDVWEETCLSPMSEFGVGNGWCEQGVTARVYYDKNSYDSIFIITLSCMTTTSTNNIMTI